LKVNGYVENIASRSIVEDGSGGEDSDGERSPEFSRPVSNRRVK
jgi:hypothetical protein